MAENELDLVIPKGFLFDPDKSTLSPNLFVNKGSYYTTESLDGLFTYYSKLNSGDEATILRWYVQSLADLGTEVRVYNPLETAQEITDAQVAQLQISPDFPKIGKDFIRLVKLYQTFCVGGLAKTNQALEVGVVLFHHEERKEFRFVLPTQKVLSTHWGWSMKHREKAYFLDGTETSLDQLEADGWTKCGTSHSHNTMNIRWSSLDEQDQVGTPAKPKMAAIHMLLYGFSNHSDLNVQPNFNLQISASVNGCWQELDPSLILDADCQESFESVDFDPSILSIVTTNPVVTYGYGGVGGYKSYYHLPKVGKNNQVRPIVQGYRTAQDDTLDEANLIRHGNYTTFYDNKQIVALLSDLFNVLVSKGVDYTEAILMVAEENDKFKEGIEFIVSLNDLEEFAAPEGMVVNPDPDVDIDSPFYWQDDYLRKLD